MNLTATGVFRTENVTESTYLSLIKNMLPRNGSCSVDLKNGSSMSDYFTITCVNWSDGDGSVKAYEYFGELFT